MSELDDLRSFADEADRRGDKEAAFAAMKKIESMSKTNPSFVESLAGQGGNVDPRELTAQGAGVNLLDVPPGILYGMGKGTRELYEGGKQAALGVGDIVSRGFRGALGSGEPGMQEAYTAQTDPIRAEREQFLSSQPSGFRGGATVGSFASKVAPAMMIRNPQTAMGRISLNTGVGAGYGFGEYISEEDSLRGESRGMNTLQGAGTGLAVGSIFEGVTSLRNIPGNYIKGKMATPVAKEGQRLEEVTGTPMTFGEKTGDPFLTKTEQSISPTLETIAERNRSLKDSVRSLTKTVRGVENKPEVVANNVKDALDDAVGAAKAKRKVVADYDYAKFRRSTGGEKVITMDNAKSELAKVAEEYKFGSSNMGRQATRLSKDLDADVNAEQFLNLRSRISDSLAGTGNLFKDIDKAVEKRIAGRLMDAIDADIESTSKYLISKGNQNAADFLKKATRNYSKNSEAIKQIEDSTLGRLFKTDTFVPEKAAESLVKMQPSEVNRAFSILRKRSPDQVKEVTALYLHNAVRKSIGDPSATAVESTINPLNIVKTLMDKEHGGAVKLRAMIPDAEERRQVINSVRAIERMADKSRPGSGSSQSATSRSAEAARVAGGGFNTTFVAGLLAKIATPIGIRKALLTEAGRKNLMILSEPVKNQAAYTAAINYFNEQD